MKRRFTLQALGLAFTALALNACQTGNPTSSSASRSPSTSTPRPVSYSAQINYGVLGNSNRSNSRVVIDVGAQKGYLVVNGKVAAKSQVSTARSGKHTPRGTFYLSERIRSGKISTIYNVEMPYWMRLNSSPFGLHAGYVPGYPASAGCIRMPYDMARLVFEHTKSGTPVSIVNSWSGGY